MGDQNELFEFIPEGNWITRTDPSRNIADKPYEYIKNLTVISLFFLRIIGCGNSICMG